MWLEVLEDCAHEKMSVAEFEAEVDRKFKQANEAAAAEWVTAREEIRKGCALDEPFRRMERVEEDVRAVYRVRPGPEFTLNTSVMDEVIIPIEQARAA